MSNLVRSLPRIENHNGVAVVRDDCLPGGTKTRLFHELMRSNEAIEFVYASPAQGMAQVALAVSAYHCCKQATVFVVGRRERAPRTCLAEAFGARIVEVAPGYLNVIQARAKAYAAERGAFYIDFGGGNLPTEGISQAAAALDINPSDVWCAAGSGTLARALKRAWPKATIHAVAVGKTLNLDQGFNVIRSPYRYEQHCSDAAPFPTDPIYEAKAWEMLRLGREGTTLFWNVAAEL